MQKDGEKYASNPAVEHIAILDELLDMLEE